MRTSCSWNFSLLFPGATEPEYVVTADDMDKLIAVECIPMDDQGRQGELLRVFANGQNKITCDPDMQLEIDSYIYKGEATFSILLLMDASETWEPTTLILKQSGFLIKDNRSQETLIAQKFSKDLSIEIPSGLSTQFVLTCSDGSSHPLNTYNDVQYDTILWLSYLYSVLEFIFFIFPYCVIVVWHLSKLNKIRISEGRTMKSLLCPLIPTWFSGICLALLLPQELRS